MFPYGRKVTWLVGVAYGCYALSNHTNVNLGFNLEEGEFFRWPVETPLALRERVLRILYQMKQQPIILLFLHVGHLDWPVSLFSKVGGLYSKHVGVTLHVGLDLVCGWWLECGFPPSCPLIPTSSVPIVASNQRKGGSGECSVTFLYLSKILTEGGLGLRLIQSLYMISKENRLETHV